MPLFMDRHDVPGASAHDVAQAHVSDLEMSGQFDVQFLSYWFDESVGGVFCFARAPSEDNLKAVHEASHGLIPNEIISVSEDDVVKFLGSVHDPRTPDEVTSPTRTVAFTDLVGSTELLTRFGEERYVGLIAEHDSIVRKALIRHHGREIKHTGDGILAAFEDAGAGVAWGLSCLEEFAARDQQPALSVRIGMASGIPVDRNDDIYGETVVLASRLCDRAGSGRLLASRPVYEAVADRGFAFRGPIAEALKGFREPVAAFELRTDPPTGVTTSSAKPPSLWARMRRRIRS